MIDEKEKRESNDRGEADENEITVIKTRPRRQHLRRHLGGLGKTFCRCFIRCRNKGAKD